MKLTAQFDPDFAALPRQKCRRAGIWRLVILCSILTAFAIPIALAKRAPGSPVIRQALVPAKARAVPAIRQPVPGTAPGLMPQPGDHFVWVASPAIDPSMVHAAPEGIDEEMVIPARDSEVAR
jgi:hypothetical protein